MLQLYATPTSYSIDIKCFIYGTPKDVMVEGILALISDFFFYQAHFLNHMLLFKGQCSLQTLLAVLIIYWTKHLLKLTSEFFAQRDFQVDSIYLP